MSESLNDLFKRVFKPVILEELEKDAKMWAVIKTALETKPLCDETPEERR